MRITRSQQDYLESLYILSGREPVVRVRDIASFLRVKMASVTGMLRSLADKELVTYKRYGYAILTKEGEKIAKKIVKKHNESKEFLTYILGVSEDEAQKVACQMEHSLSEEISRRLAMFVRFIRQCPLCGDNLLLHFSRFVRSGRIHRSECKKCVQSHLSSLVGEKR
ncbi:MAG: metal-dependent transcriptional regulator [Planctomycetota bacterium]|nr:metal-dependent transcriptional regulator [Planctomycetota bacterium]